MTIRLFFVHLMISCLDASRMHKGWSIGVRLSHQGMVMPSLDKTNIELRSLNGPPPSDAFLSLENMNPALGEPILLVYKGAVSPCHCIDKVAHLVGLSEYE